MAKARVYGTAGKIKKGGGGKRDDWRITGQKPPEKVKK